MDTTANTEITMFLSHLARFPEPFVLKANGQPPVWSDAATHTDFASRDPEMYALCGLLESAQPAQRARILFETLRASRVGVHPEVRETLDRTTTLLLGLIDADLALTVFLALRRVRANHKHTARAILTYLLNHPEAESLWQARRPAVEDCLEHALGKSALRARVRLASRNASEDPLRRGALRFARNKERAQRLLTILEPPAQPLDRTDRPYRQSHTPLTVRFADRPEHPGTITWADRGDIAASLVSLYRQEARPNLTEAFRTGLERVAARTPRFPGRVALVLDMSASLRSYGDREYSYLAQSVAFRLAQERCVRHLAVYSVGDVSPTEAASGATDLASALLDALEGHSENGAPDLVLIVSDGYENRYPGDLARVIATLPHIGVRTPIVFCQTKFTNQDDLSLRTPAPELPTIGFWHEADFPETLLSAFAQTEMGAECLRVFLLEKLARADRILKEIRQ